MSRKKLKKDDRRFLKRAGFARADREMGDLACALHEAHHGVRAADYVVPADSTWGERTRRRVRRERWNRRARCLRGMLLLVAVYGGSLAVVLLLVAAVWDWLARWIGL